MSSLSSKELPSNVATSLDSLGLTVKSINTVHWLSDTPSHPKNWPLRRKLYDTTLTVLFIIVSSLIGNAGNTVATYTTQDLQLSPLASHALFSVTFYYGQALGGLFIPPCTETFGRKRTNVVASACMAGLCAICGVRSAGAVGVGRFLGGVLSAMPAVAAAGSIEDMWGIKARIWALDAWVKGAIVGIALGPCFGTYVALSERLGWQWVFYLGAIMLATVSLLFLWTAESRPHRILQQHVQTIRKSTGYGGLCLEDTTTPPSLKLFLKTMIIRPIRFFFTEPIVSAVSVMSATVFASAFLQSEGLTVAYENFGFTAHQASLVFIAWIVGCLLTIPIRVLDMRLITRRERKHQAVRPEDKITGFFIAALVLAAAVWWWSWTVPPYAATLSPWPSIIALVLIGACINEFDGVLQGYLTDSYTTYAASANAPLAFLRGCLSGVFPLFGDQMFSGLGSNIAGSIVASIASVFVFIAIWFWSKGRSLRERSRWAVKY